MSEKTDKQLIEEYVGGEKEALHSLIRRHLKSIFNFVYRLTGKAEEAEDITQDVFIKLWKNVRKYDSDQEFKPWLYKIARNATIDWQRRRKELVFSDFETRDGENYLEENLPDLSPLPEEMFKKAEDKQFLDKILKEISPEYREVLFLYYDGDLTFAEIGKILGKPLNTVKSQHHRALLSLRNLLNAPENERISY